MLNLAGFLERLFHHILRGDARVVRAGQPHHFMARHPSTPSEDVLDRIIEHMAHCEDARDIRRRDHDGVFRLRRVLVPVETIPLQPSSIPLGFDIGGEIGTGEFRHGKGWDGKEEGRLFPAGAGSKLGTEPGKIPVVIF